jgi:hypothetical protein
MTKYFIQDGAYFFLSANAEMLGDAEPVQAPGGMVNDFDMTGAEAAREWFVGTYCPAHGITPIHID